MILLDASVVIGWLDADDAHHEGAKELLAGADDLAIAELTLAEVLLTPTRLGRAGTVLDALRDLDVRTVALPPGAAVDLARIRVDSGLKLPDCVVLHTALDLDASLATFDEHLARAARRRELRALPRELRALPDA